MTEPVNVSHDELSDLLDSLPRQTASPAFTAQTVARARQRAAGGRRAAVGFSLRTAVAVVVMLAAFVFGAIGVRHHRQELRLQQLRSEQEQIRKELDQIKAISNERDPRVIVGTSGGYDFVLGVQPRAQWNPGTHPQPVSVHIDNDGIS